MKATKNHQLLEKGDMDKQSIDRKDSVVCTEKCSVHKNETIKFFCTNHDLLGCSDCITLNHRTCDIDYIPDKCAGIGDGDEYRDTMKKLGNKIKEIDEIMKRANDGDKEIDTSYENVLKEIVKFRRELNDHLDQLQKKIQTDLDKRKSTDKEKVQKVIKACSSISTDISNIKSSLQDSKNSQQYGQLYINIKQVQSKLKTDEVQKAEESLAQTNTHNRFERSKELEKALSIQEMFGKLSDPTDIPAAKTRKTIEKLTHKNYIDVRTQSDINDCIVSGCVALSSHTIVVADWNNCKLKVVDTRSKAVIEEKALDSAPWDITVLPQDQIAVTIPEESEILIMSTDGKLSIIRRIPVNGECKGIAYHRDNLYVVCWNPYSVFIVGTQGNVQNTISLSDDRVGSPNYIVLNEESGLIYISNTTRDSVVSVTLQGDISAVYKDTELTGPVGTLMLEDGSLLVCCRSTGNIHRISGDLKQAQIMIDGLQSPFSICYNHHQQEVCIGSSNQLEVLNLHWQVV